MAAIALTAAFVVLLLTAASLPHAVGFANEVMAACMGIFSLCISYIPVFATAVMWGAVLLTGGGFLYALARNLAGLARSCLALRRFPLMDRGLGVILIRDELIKVAFTHGLIRPRIYISTGLIKTLSREEMRAVLLHETHHRRSRDPLRFFLLSLARDSFFYLPAARHIHGRLTYIRETEADDAVVRRTSDHLGLAGVLLKLAREGGSPVPSMQPASIMGSAEERIRRLLGEGQKKRWMGFRVLASSLVLAGILLSGLTIPAAFSMSPGGCELEHCDLHISEIGESCEAHCEMSRTH